MLLGGLILNLMPCVFPVHRPENHGLRPTGRRGPEKNRAHGLIFTLGVLVSFGVLSGILFVAAASGAGDRLGLSTPEPVGGARPDAADVRARAQHVRRLRNGNLRHFASAARCKPNTASPARSSPACSPPWSPRPARRRSSASAIGAAIALPALQFFTAFAAMAVGLALPYLVLSVFPRLIGFLPRPGAWMESFKQAMSFLLFATAGYLLWVYAGQIDLGQLLGPDLRARAPSPWRPGSTAAGTCPTARGGPASPRWPSPSC